MKLKSEAVNLAHHDRFGKPGRFFEAPARVNLIGEHTDYTGGLVMPMAIGFHTTAVINPRGDDRMMFYSENYKEETFFEPSDLERGRRGHWSDYPAGVAWSLRKEGVDFGGFNMTLSGDVPLGAGLSSSASIEVAAAMAILSIAGTTLPLKKVATLCRRAENEFVGAKSGIMDQFVVAGAVAHRALLLDCRSLEFDLLPLPEDVRVVIANSMVKHAVATGEYGNRRDEVEAGQAVLQRELGRELLRDATVADLEACRDKMSPESFARCRHIITENARVLAAREALLAGDLKRFGALMVEAHASFRDDFAASCPEIDSLVEIALGQPGCIGARITGGGFGGCTVNVVRAAEAEAFVAAVRREYQKATGIDADCFICEPTDGALALAEKGGVA
ncbi:MAG TPA: galactokinase [Edaphobacter sp.]|nr:galactokinase [Edaphobacter sp.]